MTDSATISSAKGLRVGDLVEVRSADEIMATLDERGELENLPFMPEMLKFCGQRLTAQSGAQAVRHHVRQRPSQNGERGAPDQLAL